MTASAVRAPVALRTPDTAAAGSPWLRLAAFSGLAMFAAGHWATFVADPPVGRVVAVVAIATATGAGLGVLGAARPPGRATHLLAAVVALAGLAFGLIAAGLEARLLVPTNWGELRTGIEDGVAGIGSTSWPYDGADDWIRHVLLLALPAALTLASALVFWPARERAAQILRGAGLVIVLVVYAVPATDHDPGAPVLRGAVLLLLLAGWLWLPRLRRRDAAAGAAALVVVGLLSVPVAAALDPQRPVIAYGAWNLFGERSVTFDWNHSYGPLDWPRRGTTLLTIKSPRPLYWKAETLDRFDGLRWVHSSDNASTPASGEFPMRLDQRWMRRFQVTVKALESDFVVTAGTPYLVTGAGSSVSTSSDGTTRALEEPLHRGDTYTVRAYVPEPSPQRLRAAPEGYSTYGGLASYTRIALPRRGETALTRAADDPLQQRDRPDVAVPLRGNGTPDEAAFAAAELRRSPYGRAYDLAKRLTAGAPTTYDAVADVRSYLRSNYTYSERPPTHPYPLESFLFGDRIGYCQQFSGAMALLLRMSGIPARVVGGFAPGAPNSARDEYDVRDLDAHSWVEVYFTGIGWVTFDPTPAGPPAQRTGPAAPPPDRAGAANSADRPTAPDASRAGGAGSGSAADEGSGGLSAWLIAAGLLGAGGLAAGAAALRARRARRDLDAAGLAEAGLEELERALPRLGLELPAGTTLLGLEQRLGRVAGPDARAYVGSLRRSRFAAGGRRPRFAGRHALRRGLTSTRGPLVWLQGLILLPPWGPRPRRPFL